MREINRIEEESDYPEDINFYNDFEKDDADQEEFDLTELPDARTILD